MRHWAPCSAVRSTTNVWMKKINNYGCVNESASLILAFSSCDMLLNHNKNLIWETSTSERRDTFKATCEEVQRKRNDPSFLFDTKFTLMINIFEIINIFAFSEKTCNHSHLTTDITIIYNEIFKTQISLLTTSNLNKLIQVCVTFVLINAIFSFVY